MQLQMQIIMDRNEGDVDAQQHHEEDERHCPVDYAKLEVTPTRSGTMKTEQFQSSDNISDEELDNVTGGRKAGDGRKTSS